MVLNPEHMTLTDDPHADASQKAAGLITVAAGLAQRAIDNHARTVTAAARAAEHAGTAEHTGAAGAAETARGRYAVMLGKDKGRNATGPAALAAFLAADRLRATDPDASLAQTRAEDRLRQLHPDAMARYAQLRTGMSSLDAMSAVAPLIDPPPGRDTVKVLEDQDRQLDPVEQALIGESRNLDSASADTALPDSALPDSAADQPRSTGGLSAQQQAAADYAPAVRAALTVELAEAVLTDPGWPRLAATLRDADRLGADPATILRDAAHQRDMSDAKSPARVLEHRLTHDDTGALAAIAAAAVLTEHSTHDHLPDDAATKADGSTRTTAPAATADLMKASYPTPLTTLSRPPSAGIDPAALAAGLALTRAADRAALAASQLRAVPDDQSTPLVDEHTDALGTAESVTAHADTTRTAAHTQSAAAYPGAASFPTPLTAVAHTDATLTATTAATGSSTSTTQTTASTAIRSR
jgi:hypothetical protein